MKKRIFASLMLCALITTLLLTSLATNSFAITPSGRFAKFEQNEYVDTKLVTVNDDGSISYGVDEESGASLPDYSGVGYRRGESEIPYLPVVKTIYPEGLDDHTALIQSAIDEVASLPKAQRGAILMKAGVYVISSSLNISKSGIVLRGEGQGTNGTIIYDSSKSQSTSLIISGTGSYLTKNATTSEILDISIPFGTAKLHVSEENINHFSIGDEVLITITPNDEWIKALGVDNLSGEDVEPWVADDYVMKYERRIVAIRNNQITLDTSAAMSIDEKYTSATISKIEDKGRITESGAENLRFESYYNHRDSDDENHGWKAISIKNCRNCWIKDVTSLYYGYSCVSVGKGAINVTVDGCSSLEPMSKTTGGRKYSFCINGGSYILVKNCYSSKGRHDFVVQDRASGPNVFYNCIADDSRNVSEPHHRWGTGTLYDNVFQVGATRRGYFEAIMRGNSGTGHGWAGVNTVFWNCLAPGIIIRKPQTEQNFAIGSYGVYGGSISGKSNYKNWYVAPDVIPPDYPELKTESGSALYGNGYIESFFNPVNPSSLYQAQLAYRLNGNALDIESPISPILNYPIYDETVINSTLTVSGICDIMAEKILVYVDGEKAAEATIGSNTNFNIDLALENGYHEISVTQIISSKESAKTPIRVVYKESALEDEEPNEDNDSSLENDNNQNPNPAPENPTAPTDEKYKNVLFILAIAAASLSLVLILTVIVVKLKRKLKKTFKE